MGAVVSAVNQLGRTLNGLSFDGGDVIVTKDGILLRTNSGQAPPPPWFPKLDELDLSFYPGAINNVIPRITWADPDTEIGLPDGKLTLTGGTSGLIVCKCTHGGAEWVFSKVEMSIATSGVPADDPASFFHVATHAFYTFESEPDVWRAVVRPLYFQSLAAVKVGDYWRW